LSGASFTFGGDGSLALEPYRCVWLAPESPGNA
jgi:hypothetical protein